MWMGISAQRQLKLKGHKRKSRFESGSNKIYRYPYCTTLGTVGARGVRKMDFNQIITDRINEKIEQQVNDDFRILKEAFTAFLRKYENHYLPFCLKLKEYTIKSLAENNHEFIMFPELQEELFRKEAHRLINEILESPLPTKEGEDR